MFFFWHSFPTNYSCVELLPAHADCAAHSEHEKSHFTVHKEAAGYGILIDELGWCCQVTTPSCFLSFFCFGAVLTDLFERVETKSRPRLWNLAETKTLRDYKVNTET